MLTFRKHAQLETMQHVHISRCVCVCATPCVLPLLHPQDGVPECLEALAQAGIKVWMLTGDKVETATSIAYSCRLFTEGMSIVEMRDASFEGATDTAMQEAVRGREAQRCMGGILAALRRACVVCMLAHVRLLS